MKSILLRKMWVVVGLALAVICGAGCTSITMDSNKDTAAVRKLSRLFIIINQGQVNNQILSGSLVSAFQGCFTNATTKVSVSAVNPLELDESIYQSRINRFLPDAVLFVSVKSSVIDQFGEYPTIIYDASLVDPISKKRIWRASINNSGSTDIMDRRMREMAGKIVQQLQRDGFL